VWSRGARADDGSTTVRLALEMRNTGEQGIELRTDEVRLEGLSNQGTPLPPAVLERVNSETASVFVPPGEAATIELLFGWGHEIAPDDIGRLRLRWVVDHDDAQRYVQFTELRRVREVYTPGYVYYDPIWGYYDPYLYGPPYGHHYVHRVPVRRVYVRDHDRDDARAHVRDHGSPEHRR
jgi:hypothetical protein